MLFSIVTSLEGSVKPLSEKLTAKSRQMRINLKHNFLQVSFICPVYVWNFRLLKRIDLKSTW